MDIQIVSMPIPLFSSEICIATPDALEWLKARKVHPHSLLDRHFFGDGGELCDDDKEANAYAIDHGERVLSCYKIGGEKVYVITEWDRSVTTVLMASEY